MRRTRSTADVVEGEVSDKGVELHEQGQGLANATGGTENGNLGSLRWKLRWLAGGQERAPRQCFFIWATHLAGRSGEATLLEEVEGLTSSEHLDCEG